MKLGVAILTIAAVAGCAQGLPQAPTAPASPIAGAPNPPSPPPPSPVSGSAVLWVMVIGNSGACIEGATIQVLRAEGAGQPIAQKTPCGVWDYDGGVVLANLTPGLEVKLRGAAEGLGSREMTFIPRSGPYQAVFIELR